MVLRPCADFGGGGGGGGGGYVDCFPQRNEGGGGHHFYESIKTELDSFRLRDDDGGDFPTVADPLLCNDDTSSIASKKRIDSMFKTTASSVAGDEKRTPPGRAHGRRARSLADDGDYFDYGYSTPASRDKNTVQEKIEKMFAEISSSELDTDVSIESSAAAAAAGKDASSATPGGGGGNKFHVQYIGCAGLSGKISSLEGLQRPVRDMYFGYRENQHQYRRDGERARDFSGLLEISAAGLTIRYRDERGDTVHRTDAFPSIAVWAALKYVCRRRQSSSSPRPRRLRATDDNRDDHRDDHRDDDDDDDDSGAPYEYAFLPLIADPDGSDKAPLFRDLDAGDRARLDAAGDHAPVFAVVTRCKQDGGRPRPLECHGFACETENDALLMAANLYGALVAAMQSSVEQAGRAGQDADGGHDDDDDDDAVAGQRERQQQQQLQRQQPPSPRRYIRQRNGFTSMSSTAGSSVAGDDVAGCSAASVPPALPPPRPPRRNKKSASSVASSAAGDDDGGDVCGDAKTFRMSVRQAPSLRRGVCTSGPAAAADVDVVASASAKAADRGGDILTKVAIPRSRSFLHSNGLASGRYSRRAAGCGIETAADRLRRRSNGSSGVMGFSDMFNELRVQEGLNNMDEILDAIIDAEGMSYNELKPIYREFLTKLSVTLTKDELYQRTKAIMAEQKRRRNNKRQAAAGRGRRLNDKLRRALNLRAAGSRLGAVLLPDFCRRRAADKRNRKPGGNKPQKRRRCACSTEPQRPAADGRKLQRRSSRRRAAESVALKGRRLFVTSSVCSTSDESEFFAAAAALAIRQRHDQLKQQQLQHKQQPHLPQPYRKSKKRGGGVGGCGSKCSGSKCGGGRASEGGCLHRASSGYFSCSECSAGAADDKCYCAGVAAAAAAEPASLVSCSCDSDSCADSDKCYCGRPRRPRNIFDELKSRGFAASESSASRADSPGTAWKKNELMMLLHRHDSTAGADYSTAAAAATVDGKCGVEPSKSIEYLRMARRRPSSVVADAQPHYSTVTAKPANDRMRVYGVPSSLDSSTTVATGCSSSSPSSSLSAATVYSSSSAVGGAPRPQRQRRSGSSGSDNFRAIDYALFAPDAGNGRAGKARAGCGRQHAHRRSGRSLAPAPAPATAAVSTAGPSAMASRRSYSSEAVHLTGCRVYHHRHHQHQQQQQQQRQFHHQPVMSSHTKAARRHSVHDGGVDDVLSSFFKSDIENSLGYYP